MSDIRYSIVVPCYNEEKNIPLLLESFSKVITHKDIELIVVNNGSTDNTSQVILEELKKYCFVKTIEVKINKGYGFGILSGLAIAKGDYLGWTHADMQTDPADVLSACSKIDNLIQNEKYSRDNLFIKGDRKGRPWLDQFFTMGMSVFESLYLGCQLWDINAQPNIFHKSFYSSWCNGAPYDFSLDLFVLYQAKIRGLDIVRFPVPFPERVHGESSWNTGLLGKWKFIKRTLEFSRELKGNL